MSKWISVIDELPEIDAAVDVWFNLGDHAGRIENCFFDGKENSFWTWTESHLSNGLVKSPIARSGVTHWMPIPMPPEVG